jgi:hypothetical protein
MQKDMTLTRKEKVMAKTPDLRPRALPGSTGIAQVSPVTQAAVNDAFKRTQRPGPWASVPGVTNTPYVPATFGKDRNVK